MKLKALFLLIVLASLSLIGCDNDDQSDTIPLEGTYEGTFTVEYQDGQTFSHPVTVNFTNRRFSSSSNPDRIPAGGSGTFKIQASTLEFTDENVWTADFDWNLILNGVYDFTAVEGELILTANKNGVGLYKYELRKN